MDVAGINMSKQYDDLKGNKFALKHGYAGTKVHGAWRSMRNRCAGVPGYVDKGIKVCKRWDSFSNFLADMGEPPAGKVALGRIDHSKDYEPGNCRWEVWHDRRIT